ncbi:MAG TPA: TetR/AcrR family transcriptional regulator [Acidimicrobiales bacterium]|nr:TetR/AcrR family transcriptional regulator [Acidimicrobiales bacterium]
MALVEATDTRSVILDAAVAEITRVGLRKLSLVEVAKAAGVSRQTVYRYFRDRDELVADVVRRDEEDVLEATRRATAGLPDLREALCVAIALVMRRAREHPMLDRLLASEPEVVVPFLASPASPVLRVARPVVEELVAERLPGLAVRRLRIVADAVARLLVSYTVSPPDHPVEDVAAVLADVCVDGLAA